MTSNNEGSYIRSSSMIATRDTMALASTVLGFDIVELWTDTGDNNLRCTYVHADESFIEKYPNVITGHYPKHKAEHKLSPRVSCQTSLQLLIYIITYSSLALSTSPHIPESLSLASCCGYRCR
jgi:hypothetical protein